MNVEEALEMAERIDNTMARRQREAMGNPEELLTSAQLARHLGVTQRTVKRYTALGLIEPVRRHEFAYLWDLGQCLSALHKAGKCEDVQLPA